MAKKKAMRKRTKGGRPVLPEVQAALVCDNVITDKEGRVSLIGIYDTITLEMPMKIPPAAGVAEFNVFVALKSGDVKGKRELVIRSVNPSGETGPDQVHQISFAGGASGINVTMRTRMLVKERGLYWFHVLIDGSLVTRIPLRILVETPKSKAPTRRKK